MRTSKLLTQNLVVAAILGGTVAASAQEAPAAEAAPPTPAAPPVAAEPTPTPPPAAEPAAPPVAAASTDAPAAAPEAAPAEEEADGPAAWIRFDADNLGTQFWAGATNDVGGIPIASDIYIGDLGGTAPVAEFDLGVAITAGDLALVPMVGVAFSFTTQTAAQLVAPQLFTIFNPDAPIYFESWIQGFLGSVFHEGTASTLYTRNFLLYKATDDFRIGPHMELTYALNDAAKVNDEAMVSLQAGGAVMYNAHGDWAGSMILYLGTETQKHSQAGDKLVGRLTYLHYF